MSAPAAASNKRQNNNDDDDEDDDKSPEGPETSRNVADNRHPRNEDEKVEDGEAGENKDEAKTVVSSHIRINHLTTGSISPLRFWILSIGVCLGLFLSMLDTSIVATSLYTIGVDLRSMHKINWVALAYTLSYLGCAVAFGRLSDVLGRRDTFLAAYALFFAFSLACGFAQNLRQLIVFRVFQGIGGSGLYSLAMIILPELCPKQLFQYVGSLIGFVIASAGVLGPVLGGVLTQHASWRWVFWINGPIGLVSVVLFFLCWPRKEHLPQTPRRSWRELDYVGSLLLIASAILVIFAFQNEGESILSSWGSAVFVAPLTVGLVCWVVLLLWEHAIDKWLRDRLAPAFPLSLFRNRFYAAGALSTLFLGYPYLLLIFSFPIRAQVVSDKNALMAGVMLLPMLGTTALGSMISGKLNATVNYLFETMTIGACLMTLACGLLTTVSGSEDDAKALGFLTFAGLGFGLSTAAATMLVTVETPLREHAPAHGILAQMRVLGGSLGISTSTICLRSKVLKHLDGLFSPSDLASIGKGAGQLSPQALKAVRLAYSQAFHQGMVAAVAVSGISILLSLGGFRRGGSQRTKTKEQIAVRESAGSR